MQQNNDILFRGLLRPRVLPADVVVELVGEGLVERVQDGPGGRRRGCAVVFRITIIHVYEYIYIYIYYIYIYTQLYVYTVYTYSNVYTYPLGFVCV